MQLPTTTVTPQGMQPSSQRTAQNIASLFDTPPPAGEQPSALAAPTTTRAEWLRQAWADRIVSTGEPTPAPDFRTFSRQQNSRDQRAIKEFFVDGGLGAANDVLENAQRGLAYANPFLGPFAGAVGSMTPTIRPFNDPQTAPGRLGQVLLPISAAGIPFGGALRLDAAGSPTLAWERALMTRTMLRARVETNLAESAVARNASNFDVHLARTDQIQ